MPSLEEPIIFLKPPSSYLPVGTGPIRLPKGAEVHHEGVQCGQSTEVCELLRNRVAQSINEIHYGLLPHHGAHLRNMCFQMARLVHGATGELRLLASL